MPTPLEDELGLGPVTNRVRRWFGNALGRMGMGVRPRDRRTLDPLTVNYEAWDAMRRTVREWPRYKEAANSLEILVSPEDWDEYWGIDAGRKEAAIATYVRARAAEKGFWISGDPQVIIVADDGVEVGDLEVVCQFVEPADGSSPSPVFDTMEHAPLDVSQHVRGQDASANAIPQDQQSADQRELEPPDTQRKPFVAYAQAGEPPLPANTVRFVDEKTAGNAYLTDDHGFRLVLQSGDCIGAVSEVDEVDADVNIRLDADGFPYAEPKQCTLGVVGGRWTVINHAAHGTMLVTSRGARLMLREPEPYPIEEGDILFIGPNRPLRFELAY